MRQFSARLNYSFGNEDWLSEQRALLIKPDSRLVTITASGDRPLHALLDNPAKVIAVDSNSIQTELLNLKSAALQSLNFDDYIGFLGGSDFKQKEEVLKRTLKNMEGRSAKFWLENKALIHKGILYQGRIEKVTKFIAGTARLFRPDKVRKLFELDNLEEQKQFVSEKWDTSSMRKVFDIIGSRFMSKLLVIDPGLYANLAPTFRLGSYIYNRMLDSLNRYLAKENLLMSLIFRGYVNKEAFPPYLKSTGSEIIRSRLGKIKPVTDNVIHYMENSPSNSFDRFSLSDIASYMSQKEFHRMLKAMHHSSSQGARFCIRQFTSDYQIPQELKDKFQREPILEKELEEKDRCFVYRFMVGTINK